MNMSHFDEMSLGVANECNEITGKSALETPKTAYCAAGDTQKKLDDCCHRTSPFDSSTSQKAQTTLLDAGLPTMTQITYINAEEKAIG